MLRKSVAVSVGYSSLLSLLDLDTNGPITFGLSKAATGTFTLFGTLDSAATDATNAQSLGPFSVATVALAKGLFERAKRWPYLFVLGSTGASGTFYVTGDSVTAATVASTTAPASGLYSSVLDLTSYSAAGVRIGGGATMTADDAFLVYVTQDSTVTDSTGCELAGKIIGGGGTGATSIVVEGWPYAIVQRAGGPTTGTIKAAGALPVSGGGTTGSASNTTATNVAITMSGHDSFTGLAQSGTNITTMSTATASQSFVGNMSAGLMVPQADFPPGAWTGNISFVGKGRDNLPLSATLLNPGAGGGIVKASVAFTYIQTVTNSAPSGAGSIGLQSSSRFAVSIAPVSAIIKVTESGGDITPAITETDLVNGWVDLGGGISGADTYDALFAYPLNLLQAAHTHAITIT